MPSRRLVLRLRDILDNIDRIERFTAGMDLPALEQNDQAVLACLHCLLIISEAARKLGDDAAALMPSQPWQGIRSIGNVLRHEYDDVDPQIVWRLLRNGDLASLKRDVEGAIERLAGKPQQ